MFKNRAPKMPEIVVFKYLYGLLLLGILCALSALPSETFAKSSRAYVSDGNRAYQQGLYDEALDAYEKASVDEPESPQIYFNKGNAYYMKGDYQKAIELFEKAALKSKSLTLEAQSYFNMGNALFRESERQRDSDLQKSVKALEQAVRHYQKALKVNPEFEEASHNIEIARVLMKQIMDEIKKQQERTKKEQEKQQQALKKIKELIEQQEKLTEDTKTLGERMKNEGRSDEVKERFQDLADEQHKIKKDTDKLKDGMTEAVNEHLDRAIAEQDKSEDSLDMEDPEYAISSEQKAKEELEKALEAMSKKDGNKPRHDKQGEQNQQRGERQQQEKQQQAVQQQNSSEKKSKEEEKKQGEQQAVVQDEDAHNILDEERRNRDKRQLRAPGGYRAVDRDW